MRIEDFDFELPKEQIAQSPLAERDGSRLLVVSRSSGRIEHRVFRELPELLSPGDLVVVNDSRVIPARLLGKKAGTGGRVELLLLHPASGRPTSVAMGDRPGAEEWICLGQASKRLKPGAEIELVGMRAILLEALGGGQYRVRFQSAAATLAEALDVAGTMPLPPYIDRPPTREDESRYQTVYASAPGSVAAPTAGLHFTPSVLEALTSRGIERVAVTLDVGPGTFVPVRDGDISRHRMHSERYEVPRPTADAIARAKAERRRVVAVGTTVVRTLESAFDGERVRPGRGETSLFIKPGDQFRVIDVLLTNFHLPRSTLLMLVCAFLGTERTLSAYREAVARGYRFFSYGDAMLIGDFG